jgi:metal-responsive CopG/Arc/MetJ family transcriptional regulator
MIRPTRGIQVAKAKISVTVDQALIDACDKVSPRTSRSEIVQAALGRWLRDRRRLALEDEIERYYGSLDDGERAEDARWAEAGAQALGETWK